MLPDGPGQIVRSQDNLPGLTAVTCRAIISVGMYFRAGNREEIPENLLRFRARGKQFKESNVGVIDQMQRCELRQICGANSHSTLSSAVGNF